MYCIWIYLRWVPSPTSWFASRRLGSVVGRVGPMRFREPLVVHTVHLSQFYITLEETLRKFNILKNTSNVEQRYPFRIMESIQKRLVLRVSSVP